MNMNKPHATAALSNAKPEPVRGLFIDGKEQPPGGRETFPIISPGTGEVIAHTVNATESDVDAAVASARRAFESAPW
jgi:acyl-CoA reductase-like NAD-dependent aldehyde dehydrogenase